MIDAKITSLKNWIKKSEETNVFWDISEVFFIIKSM